MYNDYKLSKRAPVPEPRDIQRPKSGSQQKLVRQDSEVYAYINPEDVAWVTLPHANHLSRLVGKPTMWFPNRFDTNDIN